MELVEFFTGGYVQCLTNSLQNLPRPYELKHVQKNYVESLRLTSKLLKLIFMRLISRKELEGEFPRELARFFDIFLYSDLCTAFGASADFAKMSKTLLDNWKHIYSEVGDFVSMISGALADVYHKMEVKPKFISKCPLGEVYSVTCDILFVVFNALIGVGNMTPSTGGLSISVTLLTPSLAI